MIDIWATGESCDQLTEACLCVRIKSTLAKRGVHIKSAGYRVRLSYRFVTLGLWLHCNSLRLTFFSQRLLASG